ncbi:MAG: aldehyde oxidase and xanthine dehydrogenase molybdopterin-binding protein [Ramlibacter sp.]|nr:aldehyde oxidase and xanthine dehydrogenase molybdopterin-binding protein [Ramlibacter sp.]
MAAELSRRTFLQGSSLVVLFSMGAVQPLSAQAPAPLPGSLQTNRRLDAWLRIHPNGTVTMFTGKVELGQGILTALTQIVSDELDVAPERIEVVSGDTARTPNEGVTSGSLSMQDSGTALRMACAEARDLLVQAGATRLGAAPADLTVVDGSIGKTSGGPRVSYWEITSEVSLQREATAKVAPKRTAQHRLIGQSVKRRDIPAKVTGGAAYVQDIRLPGMVHARVVRSAIPHARLVAVDLASVRAMPGVLAVVRDGSFLGVAAQREEQAIAAARALHAKARWEGVGALPPRGAALFPFMKTARSEPTVVVDKASATAPAAATTLTAEYTRPYQAHGSIGPSCAVAQWDGDKLRVWCHSQGVFPLRADMAKALRMPVANIAISHGEGSGCYGHNGADDVAMDAALIAKGLAGVPVRLQWMREDEFASEPLGSPMVMQMRGGLDAAGRIADWQHELWSYTHSTRPNDPDGSNLLAAWQLQQPLPPGPSRNIPQPSGGSDRNAVPLYAFPRQKVINHLLLDQPIRTSALRTLGAYANVFAAESFMDEMAGAAGADPVAFRLAHLEDPRGKAVIERVAQMANWRSTPAADTRDPRTPVRPGTLRGRGMAFSKYKNLAVYCAVVADVAVDTQTGEVRVLQAWSAADAGLVVNPDGLRNQIEGGMVQSTSWTLYESIPYDESQLTGRNWPDYRILRFTELPKVEVALINRPEERPLGVGEGAQGPMVAAIANAFANATGRRLRDLPFTPERVKARLA